MEVLQKYKRANELIGVNFSDATFKREVALIKAVEKYENYFNVIAYGHHEGSLLSNEVEKILEQALK